MTNPIKVIGETFKGWTDDGGPQLSAAIAYYSVLSLAPLLLLVSALASLAFDGLPDPELRQQLRMVLGSRGTEFAMSIIEESSKQNRDFPGLAGNLIVLVIGATIVFANVQGALNRIWGLRWTKGGVVRGVLRQRLLAFAMIVVTGVILLISLGLSTAAGLMSQQLEDVVGTTLLVSLIDAAISVVVLAVLFGASFRILPDGDVAWRDVFVGAVATAMLFVLGKLVVTLYLTHAGVVGAYGVAGSMVFFLIWIYYSAAIFFLGAEFTQVWASKHGRPIEPNEGAVRVEQQVVERDARPEMGLERD